MGRTHRKRVAGSKFLEFARSLGAPPTSVMVYTAPPPLDEQGAPWPPPEALVARVGTYAGNPEVLSSVVEIHGRYEPGGDDTPYLECTVVEGDRPGCSLLFLPCELLPLNLLSAAALAPQPAEPIEGWAADLARRLAEVGVPVLASKAAEWSPDQRRKMEGFLALAEAQRKP